MRWNTVSVRACSAMIGINCTADEPVPTTATSRPLKSTGSCGHAAECSTGPANVLSPSKAGVLGADSGPIAVTMKRALQLRPSSLRTRQQAAASSKCAAATRVLKRMSRRRSKRSATWLA